MNRALTVAGLAAALACASISLAAPASAASCAAGYSTTHVRSGVDWAKVHRHQGTQSSDVVGEIPTGGLFCYNALSKDKIDGHYWRGGYGYHGSTKLTGWVAADLLRE